MSELHIRTVVVRRRMVVRRRSHQHRFLRQQYHEPEIRSHSNFPSYITTSPYRVPETTNHSSSSMPIQNAPNIENMHNLHPLAFREFPSHMFMDTNGMSYETLHNVQEFPSLGDPHSDMRLDIDGMSYEELLELSEWINDNSKRGLSEDIITKHMQTKSYLLPENLGDQESDICIICQDEYKNKEEIGILQCGHEYHAECIKRWLHEKNICPICKSKGLTIE
ncbi:hypothetical protein V8G54_024189 [Vigna mungo]|uniref:RING-type E3 ubiquitin transferase n=1 Tax=Vigna mungo TaxID=3915 RepID=A0AAQ3N563_VIGMU